MFTRAMRLTITVALMLSILALADEASFDAPHVYAQAKVEMAASAGYGSDGLYLIGEWFPVRVTLTNPPGGSARRVRVLVDSLGGDSSRPLSTYSREVDLPAQSRKEVTLYAYSTAFNRTLDVRLLDGNTDIGGVTVNLSPLEHPSNLIVGVLSSDPSLLNALNGEGLGHTEYPPQQPYYSSSTTAASASRASVAHIGLGDIPPLSSALDSLDVIVVDDMDTGAWSASQKASLSAWIGRGGMLIGLGRPGGAGSLSGVADLLPVTLGDPRALSGLSSLGDLVATPITPTGQTLAPSAELRTGRAVSARTLASQDSATLVAVRDLGEGHVAYAGLSPAVAPLKGWDGTVKLFKRLIAEHPVSLSGGALRRTGYSYGSNLFSSNGELFDMPGLDLPPVALVGLFLLVYIIIIGPVNFIVLRRIGRGELAWVTIPALVLVFSVGAYIVGYGAKGGDLLAVRHNIVHTAPGLAQASLEHFFGVFSPQRGTYGMEVASDSTVTEISSSGYASSPEDPVLVAGGGDAGPTRLLDVDVNTLSLRAFMAESYRPAESPLEADLYLGENAIQGTVRNRSTSLLEDVALMRGDEVQLIGDLAPGTSAEVRLNISQSPLAVDSPARLLRTPPGVDPVGDPNYYGQRRTSDEQRRYNRKVHLLSAGLGKLVSDTAPTNLAVVALAWGQPAPIGFAMPSRNPRVEELNLWTTRLSVRGDGPVAPKLNSGSIPFAVHIPGGSPPWLDYATANSSSLTLDPYADLLLSLPANTQPRSLRLAYDVTTGDKVAVLGHNKQTGKWDRLGEMTPGSADANFINVPSPDDYTGPSGDVTLRLLSESGPQLMSFSPLLFELNGDD